MSRIISILFVTFIIGGLGGCDMPLIVKDVEQPVVGESIVFGHVDVVIDGEIKEWGKSWADIESCCLMILPPESNEAITYKIDKDSIFYWSLPPGEYQILGFRFEQGGDYKIGMVNGSFTVPEDTDAVYIGNISINLMNGRYVIVVKDKSDDLITAYKNKFPQRKSSITTDLLQKPDKLGSFTGITSECDGRWQVDCSDKYRGVTPLTPMVKTNQFAPVDNLMPMFSWQAAGNKNATYDLVIYEVANYSSVAHADQKMKGRLIIYEEDLSEPTYNLKLPLKENTSYYWSVRLRDGDVVSRWSTYSHFDFYVFYSSSGYGQWFSFSTP